MFAFLSYRKIEIADARLLLDWRTAPQISRHMITDVPYDIARQEAWIERSNARTDYGHRIIRIKGEDVGFCSITVTDTRNGIGELGVYIGDETVPKELTIYNFVGTLNHAFFTMGLHKIVNHIMGGNERTVRLQAFNGYRHVGVLEDHVLKDGRRHDLHIFEQSAAQWARFRQRYGDDRDWDGNPTVPSFSL